MNQPWPAGKARKPPGRFPQATTSTPATVAASQPEVVPDPHAIPCTEEELEAQRLEATPPGSPMPDVDDEDDADAAWTDDPFTVFDDEVEIPGVMTSTPASVGGPNQSFRASFPDHARPNGSSFHTPPVSSSHHRHSQSLHASHSRHRYPTQDHRSRHSLPPHRPYEDPYHDYHRRKEEEKQLRKLLAEQEAKAKEKKNIQDYVSDHLIELLERHLSLTSSSSEGKDGAADEVRIAEQHTMGQNQVILRRQKFTFPRARE